MTKINTKEIEELFDDETWVIENPEKYDSRDVANAKTKLEAMWRIINYINHND